MTKKRTFIVLATSFFLSHLVAEEQALVVKLKNGTENEQVLSSMQRITFNANSMNVVLKNGQTTPISISEIQKILFVVKNGNSVSEVIASNGNSISVYPNPVQDVLYVDGVEANTVINIFNINGVLFLNTKAGEPETKLNVGNLEKGVYILQAGNQAIKFIKK